MNSIDSVFVLARQVVLVLAFLWLITISLFVVWVWSIAAIKTNGSLGRWRTFAFGCLPPFAMPLVILIIGVVFMNRGEDALAFPQYLIVILLLAHVPLVQLHCRWWKEQQWVVLASWIFAGYLSAMTAFISSMSVTGDWP